ncbi:MAG: 4-hydroxy-3-methylbut-2-enyl diphosphate reductase [Rikenellaceae bacterium]|nr:4-hydroxy-3-methylbut-2-enyl diphosphate reductase [Rikenellaceae bacterium]
MKVEIDDKSGFCFGVVRAIGLAEEALRQGTVYSLGDIVHNKVEVQRLGGLGLATVGHDRLGRLGAGSTVLVRAHGEPPEVFHRARAEGYRVVDATCPVVAKLQGIVRSAYRDMREAGGQVVILGKKGHAEVVGLAGQAGGDVIVVEGPDDLGAIDFERPVYLLSQTTQSLTLFEQISREIKRRAADPGTVTVHDTICRQVANREPHLGQFARQFDVVLFVSGRKSSNGKVLYGVCLGANPRTYLVEDCGDLRAEWFAGAGSVGICGATSTPRWLMEQVAREVESLAARTGADETRKPENR